MPNRVRPRCPTCDAAMGPVFRKGPRGKAFVRIRDAFYCPEHNLLAHGRKKPSFA
jgi:peptide methionine sulfoxide reductase MsrB